MGIAKKRQNELLKTATIPFFIRSARCCCNRFN